MQLAEKFRRPIFTFIDTPGAYPGLGAEERGQGEAIAYNLREMSRLKVPILVTAECTYHQLGAFLERVGKMPRIVSLGEFRLIGIDRPTGTLRAEMTIATYTFRPEGAPPPPAKPGAPPAPPAAAPPAQPR